MCATVASLTGLGIGVVLRLGNRHLAKTCSRSQNKTETLMEGGLNRTPEQTWTTTVFRPDEFQEQLEKSEANTSQ